MGYFLLKCSICGAPIGAPQHLWLNEFRAIYTNGHQWSVPHLSGIGIRRYNETDMDTSEVMAPVDIEARYDDLGYEQYASKVSVFGFSPFIEGDNLLPPLGDPNTRIEDSSWGFLFHGSCWTLLTEAYRPKDIDIQALNNLCRSFPTAGEVVDWGHDFGGIFDFPDSEIMPSIRRSWNLSKSTHTELTCADPLDIYGLHSLLNETADINASAKPSSQLKTPHPHSRKDPFGRIPVEIREMILCLLPSKDVVNLALTSRYLASMSLSQAFWASRFGYDFGFASIFEAKREVGLNCISRDWRTLFHGLFALRDLPNLRNRQRIWNTVQSLLGVLSHISTTRLYGSPAPTFYEPDIHQEETSWRIQSASIREPKLQFNMGCRALFSRTAHLQLGVIGVYVSVIQFYNTKFISGLRFAQSDGTTVKLGYIIPENETYLGVHNRTKKGAIDAMSGFRLAIGRRGIQALAVVSHSGAMSDWAGYAVQGIPRARLLTTDVSPPTLKAEFDGLKLISLAFSDSRSGIHEKKVQLHETLFLRDTAFWVPDVPDNKSLDEMNLPLNHSPELSAHQNVRPHETLFLRDTALWIPDVPDDKLSLNEVNLRLNHPSPLSYKPLHYLHFGGQQGDLLQKILSISVWVVDFHRCVSIEIEYKEEIEGARVHSLGQRGPFSEFERQAFGTGWGNSEEKMIFAIDGPAGERISTVDIGRFSTQYTSIQFFKVHTNRGRSFTFPKAQETCMEPSTVKSSGSTAITGFYIYVSGDSQSSRALNPDADQWLFTRQADPLLDSLGVITENI